MKQFSFLREVWGHNLKEEILVMNRVIRTHRIIAFDTEFPGFVHPSPRDASEVQRFQALVSNVNNLKLIQLGLVLFNEHGSIGGCWQFNFSDFDVSSDSHVPESIELLKKNGIDFEKNRKEGVCSDRFVERFNAVLARYRGLKWVTFHGIYDVAYLSKILLRTEIPKDYEQFGKMVSSALRGELYDVKLIVDCILGQGSMGLAKLAKKLCVGRIGEAHQAGSDSLVTAQLFIKLYRGYFIIYIQKLLGGYLYGISLRFGNSNASSVKLQREQPYTVQKQCYVPNGCYWAPRQQYVVVNPCVPIYFTS